MDFDFRRRHCAMGWLAGPAATLLQRLHDARPSVATDSPLQTSLSVKQPISTSTNSASRSASPQSATGGTYRHPQSDNEAEVPKNSPTQLVSTSVDSFSVPATCATDSSDRTATASETPWRSSTNAIQPTPPCHTRPVDAASTPPVSVPSFFESLCYLRYSLVCSFLNHSLTL